jgi:hypothetical protein
MTCPLLGSVDMRPLSPNLSTTSWFYKVTAIYFSEKCSIYGSIAFGLDLPNWDSIWFRPIYFIMNSNCNTSSNFEIWGFDAPSMPTKGDQFQENWFLNKAWDVSFLDSLLSLHKIQRLLLNKILQIIIHTLLSHTSTNSPGIYNLKKNLFSNSSSSQNIINLMMIPTEFIRPNTWWPTYPQPYN